MPTRVWCEKVERRVPLVVGAPPPDKLMHVEGVYATKIRGRVTFRYRDIFEVEAALWAVEQRRGRREEGYGRFEHAIRLIDYYSHVEATRHDTVKTPDGEVAADDVYECLKLRDASDVRKCIREKAEEFERWGRKELERRELYGAFLRRLAGEGLLEYVVASLNVKALFRALDVVATFAEYFGVKPRALREVFSAVAYGGGRPAILDDFVVVGERAVWPLRIAAKPNKRIHVVNVDGVEFKYDVYEYPYGAVAYDSE